MTFSLIARCPRTGQVGVAAATGAMAVGKLVSYACAGIGAVATQAYVNPYLGIDGLKLLGQGAAADEALQRVLERDPEPHLRQVAMIDRAGRVAAHTGRGTTAWAGHRSGDGISAQGNRLAGPEVLESALKAYDAHAGLDLAHRLLLAIEAGDARGGDRKNEASAALLVYDDQEYPLWDVRIDHHPSPVRELRRLFELFEKDLLPVVRQMPIRAPAGPRYIARTGEREE